MLLFSAIRGGNTVAADTTPPTFSVEPAVTPSSTGGTATATINETGSIYYVVVTDGATAPSVAQVMAGQNASGAAALASGSATSTTMLNSSITTLSASTAYDAYFAAKDAANNNQAAVTLVNFTTDAASGTVYLNEDLSTFTNTSAGSSVRSQLIAAGFGDSAVDMADGHCEIAAAPWDAGKKCVIQKYTTDGDGTKMRFYLPSGTVQELWVKWTEYRHSTYDFAPEKCGAFNSYNNTSTGHSGTLTQSYHSLGRYIGTQTSGVDDCEKIGLYNQGGGSYPGGDGADIIEGNFVMSRATAYTMKLHLKVNNQGSANAIAEFYVNGVAELSRSSFTLSDTAAQTYIKSFQWGMDWTNGGVGVPAGTNWRYLTDLWIGDYDPDA